MDAIHTQQISVRLGSDPEQGALLLAGDELIAMVVRLDPVLYANDPDIAGKWSLELGFGACTFRKETILFETLEEAQAWARQCLEKFAAS